MQEGKDVDVKYTVPVTLQKLPPKLTINNTYATTHNIVATLASTLQATVCVTLLSFAAATMCLLMS
jgi:hypothetical protein